MVAAVGKAIIMSNPSELMFYIEFAIDVVTIGPFVKTSTWVSQPKN